jgi:hypothetical protein
MTPEQYKEFTEQFGKDATDKMKEVATQIEKDLNDKYELKLKGLLTEKDFNDFKNGEIKKLNDQIDTMEKAAKTQGEKINELLNGQSGGG